MPVPQLKAFAERSGKSLSDVEGYWNEAKVEAEAKGLRPGDGKFWKYVSAIVQRRCGLRESMSFKEFLALEHKRSEHDTVFGPESMRAWLQDSTVLPTVLSHSDDKGAVTLNKCILAANQVSFVFSTQKNKDVPVGYIVIQQDGKVWFVISSFIVPALRGKSLGVNAYLAIAEAGYRLRSADVLSAASERTWLKLGAQGAAKVLDSETGEILPFDESPMDDTDDLEAGSRFYWVTENSSRGTRFYFKHNTDLNEEDVQRLAFDKITRGTLTFENMQIVSVMPVHHTKGEDLDLFEAKHVKIEKGLTRKEAMNVAPWKASYGDCRGFSYNSKTGEASWV